MVINCDLMVINGDLMVVQWDLMGFNGNLPSGELTKSNWKWPSRNSGWIPMKIAWWIFPLRTVNVHQAGSMVGWWNSCEDDINLDPASSHHGLKHPSRWPRLAVWNVQLHMAGQWKSKSHPMQITMENGHGKLAWEKMVEQFGCCCSFEDMWCLHQEFDPSKSAELKDAQMLHQGQFGGIKDSLFHLQSPKNKRFYRWVVDSNESQNHWILIPSGKLT